MMLQRVTELVFYLAVAWGADDEHIEMIGGDILRKYWRGGVQIASHCTMANGDEWHMLR